MFITLEKINLLLDAKFKYQINFDNDEKKTMY